MAEVYNAENTVFGLDIGTRSIVGTVGYKQSVHDFTVVAQAVKLHDTRAMMDGQIHDINKVAEKIKADKAAGKEFSIVAVSEAAKPQGGEATILKVREDSPDPIRLGGVGAVVADQLEALVGSEARATILGHIQRGGTPTAHDRVLSSRYGYAAVEMAMRGEFGRMVALKGDTITSVSLEDAIGQKTKNIAPDHELLGVARAMGICFGD